MSETTRSRRQFLRGSAATAITAAASLAGGTAGHAAPRSSAGSSVAILGGGVAGLSAAHELNERGFAVTVWERDALGGKARSMRVPGSGSAGRPDLPGEHGFRFFPGFYHNLTDTMRRIPFPGNANGTWDNLTRASTFMMSRTGGRQDLTIPFPFPLPTDPPPLTPGSFLASAISVFETFLRLPPHEAAFAAEKLLVFATSCDERRLGQWEHLSWSDYIRSDWFSDEYNTLLADGLIRNLAASKSKDASTYSIGLVGEATFWSVLGLGNEPGASVDRVLAGATNEMWIDPWAAHLARQGVTFNLGWAVESVDMAGGRVTSATVVDSSGRRQDVRADWFLSAIPVERAVTLLSPDVLAADPSLAGMRRLGTDWMVGLQFFLKQEVPLTPGHVNFAESGWAVTSISQQQFWRRPLSEYGDGTVRDCLSTILSDWSSPGNFTGKSARESTPDEIAAEVWRVLKDHLNDTGEPLLTDDMLRSWFLDPAITGSGTSAVANDTPLFIQLPGTWDSRPTAETAIPNLFFAGDWVKTNINVTTMEGANEGARQAVNALLDAAGSNAPRCSLTDLWVNRAFDLVRADDRVRYRLGLPNAFDLVDTRFP